MGHARKPVISADKTALGSRIRLLVRRVGRLELARPCAGPNVKVASEPSFSSTWVGGGADMNRNVILVARSNDYVHELERPEVAG
jgi:hypothetical protein